MADTLQVELREQVGTKRMRRLRKTGRVPAVLYGHKETEQHLVLSSDQIMAVVRHGGRVVKLAGAVTNDALIREVQWDTFGKEVLHVDFIRVDASERVHTVVTVEGKGVAAGSSKLQKRQERRVSATDDDDARARGIARRLYRKHRSVLLRIVRGRAGARLDRTREDWSLA